MQEASKKAFDEATASAVVNAAHRANSAKKRKRESTSSKESTNKKPKLETKDSKKKEKSQIKGQSKLSFKAAPKKSNTPKKGSTPKKVTPKKEVIDVSDSDSDFQQPLSKIKQNGDVMEVDSDDSDAPLAVIQKTHTKSPRKKLTPKKKPSNSSSDVDSDDSDVALIKIAKSPSKSSQSSQKKGRGRPKGSPNKKPKGSLAAARVSIFIINCLKYLMDEDSLLSRCFRIVL